MPIFQVKQTRTSCGFICHPGPLYVKKPFNEPNAYSLISGADHRPLRQFPFNHWNWRRGAGGEVAVNFSPSRIKVIAYQIKPKNISKMPIFQVERTGTDRKSFAIGTTPVDYPKRPKTGENKLKQTFE